MDRLTPKDLVEVLNMPQYGDMTRFLLYAQKLWHMENKLERGKLVELPCNIGDTIYYVYTKTQREVISFMAATIKVIIDTDGELRISVYDENGNGGMLRDWRKRNIQYLGADKTIAEARLKELQESGK